MPGVSFYSPNNIIMPPHIKVAVIFVGSVAAIIWLLVFVHNRDKKKKSI